MVLVFEDSCGGASNYNVPGNLMSRRKDHSGGHFYHHKDIPKPIAYWPLDETSGSAAKDRSGTNAHGTYTNVTREWPGCGGPQSCAKFNATSSYVNIYSAALAAAFSGVAGSLAVWAKMTVAALTDTNAHNAFYLEADGDNYISFYKSTTDNVLVWDYKAGGTAEQGSVTVADDKWHVYVLTWTDAGDKVCYYTDGAVAATADTGIGTWAGAPAATKCTIGAATTTPTNVWMGSLSHCALWDVVLTADQVKDISKV